MNERATVIWVLFGLGGRIARQSFILGQLFMLTLFAVVVARILDVQGDEGWTTFWGLMFLLLGAVSAWSLLAMTVKRLHDVGWPGALALVLFVPTINFLFVIALMIMPSQPQANRYGPPPFGQPILKGGRQKDSSRD